MSINSKEFNKEYYYNVCLGSEEFKKSKGLKITDKVKKLVDTLNLNSKMNILEVGCGRGDTALYLSKRVNSVIGIDYSITAINIANMIKKKLPTQIKKKVVFRLMRADKLDFEDNMFDVIIFIDTIDHLSDREVNKTLKIMSRILKKKGLLFIKTCSNKNNLNTLYKYYTYPVNKLLTYIDQKIKNIKYDSLPENPRTKEQLRQHINEPTYFYLKKVFKKHKLNGRIDAEIGFLKNGSGFRTKLYNFIIALYPLSLHFPLKIFFAGSFICYLTNDKN